MQIVPSGKGGILNKSHTEQLHDDHVNQVKSNDAGTAGRGSLPPNQRNFSDTDVLPTEALFYLSKMAASFIWTHKTIIIGPTGACPQLLDHNILLQTVSHIYINIF